MKTFVHLEPVWRTRANFILMARVPDEDSLEESLEQMWAERLTNNEFLLCCIPFRTYGLALGDVVKTAPELGRDYVITERVQASGRLVYRAWFGNVESTIKHDLRFQAVVKCQCEAWFFEWYSDNLLAIDIPGVEFKGRFDEVFTPMLKVGVLFEPG